MAVGKTLVLNDDGLPGEINTMAGWGVIGSRPATGDVLAGSFYYDTTNSILYQEQNGSWVAVLQIKTLNAANETVEAGYYAATTLSAIDAQLAAVNILSGVNIFGFVGVATVQDIADANLVVAEAPTGKKFYAVTGGVKTGTGTKTLNPANENVVAGYYEGTTLSTIDVDLIAANIKRGTVIFGFTGTHDGIDDVALEVNVAGFQAYAGIGTANFPQRINDNDTGTGANFTLGEYAEVIYGDLVVIKRWRQFGNTSNLAGEEFKLQYWDVVTDSWTDWVTGIDARITANWSGLSTEMEKVTTKIRMVATATALSFDIMELEVIF